jgi:CelD/BcsL family acetyltransferase involved in cellulose biosynthesis
MTDLARPVLNTAIRVRTTAGQTSGGYRITQSQGEAAVLDALRAAANDTEHLLFQSPHWLACHFATLTRAHEAHPIAFTATSASTGKLALVLPLVAVREHGLSVLRHPSFGVSDYAGPLIGPAAPDNLSGAIGLWRALRSSLVGHDLLVLDNMPRQINGRINPLALLGACDRARHLRNVVRVETNVEDLLRGRGKHYFKEAKRCQRLIEQRGPVVFKRMETPDEIERAYAILRDQQAHRRRAMGDDYVLDQPEFDDFYRQLLREGSPQQVAHLFTLSAGGEVCATLLGVTHRGTFTLLRISTSGGEWMRMSPGRLIIIAAMRHFVTQNVRAFDLGIGTYAFKERFGIAPEPLVRLVTPLSSWAWPHWIAYRIKERARALIAAAKAAHCVPQGTVPAA